MSKNTVLSLFAGAGGCSLGFVQAGYTILWANDQNPIAAQTYSQHFPKTSFFCGDIRHVDFAAILNTFGLQGGDLDCIIGGPPCQGFSSAGMRVGSDPRNQLLQNYVHALEICLPKWFLMENVEGLLTLDGGRYLSAVVRAVFELGYSVCVEKIYAHEYGIPQRRKRVIIVGNRLGHHFDFPKPRHLAHGQMFRKGERSLRDAIGSLPDAAVSSNEVFAYAMDPKTPFEQYLRGQSQGLSEHVIGKQTPLQSERMTHLQMGQSMKDLPKHLQHESFTRRANRRVCDGTPSERRGGAPSGMKRLYYDEPCLTITGASCRELIHPVANRPLTLRECARIQTFPDDFVFLGNASEKMQQIGNAIPPLLAKQLAEHIRANYGFDLAKKTPERRLSFHFTKSPTPSPALKIATAALRSLDYPTQQNFLEFE